MSLGEIFSDAIKYPFSDITKFLMVGIIALLSGLSSLVMAFKVQNTVVLLLAAVVSLIFALFLSGYGVGVIKKGIERSDEIPDIDPMTNIVNGVKALIIGIVYFLIPIVITVILMLITGAIGSGLNHAAAGLGIGLIISIILFIAFAIFETVAMARFADTEDLGAALSIGEVIEDVKKIGISQIIAFVIIAFIILVVAYFIAGLIGLIPFVGIIISSILVGGFVALFYNKALGLLYSEI